MDRPKIRYLIVPVTPFQQNCTIFYDTGSLRGAIVDPGGDLERLQGVIDEHGVKIEKILVTHGHLDHAGGVAEMAQRLAVPIEGPHEDDRWWITSIPVQTRMFGLKGRRFTPDRWLNEGETVEVAGKSLAVRHCPGHTPGHVIFFEPTSRVAMVGDVLFAGSVGRTDLPGGNHQQLIDSIVTKLWPLGDDVRFIPGHGPRSSFGRERQSNPFVADRVTG